MVICMLLYLCTGHSLPKSSLTGARLREPIGLQLNYNQNIFQSTLQIPVCASHYEKVKLFKVTNGPCLTADADECLVFTLIDLRS